MIRPSQQRVQHAADHSVIAAVFLEAGADLLFELLVRGLQHLVHRDRAHFFPVTRQISRDVLQTYKGAVVHQGEAPSSRLMVSAFLVFLEQALSSAVIRSMVSITPKLRVNRSLPTGPHS